MDTHRLKTTVELDQDILYLAKLAALKEKKALREIIDEGLKLRLGLIQKENNKKTSPKIGGYKLGGIKGTLRRTDIFR